MGWWMYVQMQTHAKDRHTGRQKDTLPVKKENAKTQLAGPTFESLCVVFA